MVVQLNLTYMQSDHQSYMSKFMVTGRKKIHNSKTFSAMRARYEATQRQGRLKSIPDFEIVTK